MGPTSLPPGFRFHPTDEELVAYYLERKISGRTIELEIIPEIDLYKSEPWELPEKSYLQSKDKEWYFYSTRDRKYPNGSRTNRATRAGYWKATGKDRSVYSHKLPVGMKKTLVYYKGRAPHGIRTNWVMHEYRLLPSPSSSTDHSSFKDSYALCRVFKKSIQIPRRKSGSSDQDDIDDNDGKDVEEILVEGEDPFGIETHEDHEESLNPNHDHYYNKFSNSDSSSNSELIDQVTSIENLHVSTPHLNYLHASPSSLLLASDEANSASHRHHDLYSSNLFQDIQMPTYESMMMMMNYNNQLPPYHPPPLEVEDFPQINIAEKTKTLLKPEIIEEYMNYGTFEDIFSLCSSSSDQDHQRLNNNSTNFPLSSMLQH